MEQRDKQMDKRRRIWFVQFEDFMKHSRFREATRKHTHSEIVLIPWSLSASSHHCRNLCGHGDSQSQRSKGEVAGMWREDMLQMTWTQRGYRLRKLSSYVLSHHSPLLLILCFSYKLLLCTFCTVYTACLIMSMFLYVHFHPLPLLFSLLSFLSQLFLFRQQGPLYSLRCLWVPGPACLCMVNVCMCVSQLENSCHIQPSHAAQLRLTATIPVNVFLSSIHLFLTNISQVSLGHLVSNSWHTHLIIPLLFPSFFELPTSSFLSRQSRSWGLTPTPKHIDWTTFQQWGSDRTPGEFFQYVI